MEEMETTANIDGLEVVYAKPQNADRYADALLSGMRTWRGA